MIDKILLSREPLAPGEERTLVVRGKGPFRVTEKCFVFSPPPPRYEACEACATRVVGDDQPTKVRAPADLLHARRMELRIGITSEDGSTAEISIPVEDPEGDGAHGTAEVEA